MERSVNNDGLTIQEDNANDRKLRRGLNDSLFLEIIVSFLVVYIAVVVLEFFHCLHGVDLLPTFQLETLSH